MPSEENKSSLKKMASENRQKIGNWLKVRTAIGDKYIPVNKIVYVKAENKSSTIYFEDLPSLKTIHLLKWYQNKLDYHIFIRCHHSYIINCLKIEFLCSNTIITKENFRIPISRKNKLHFKKIIADFYEYGK